MSDVFDAVDRKLIRVEKDIEAIQACVDTYSARNPAKLVSDSKGKATVDLSVPPPLEIAVFAGEAIYHMRSALDHLAFHLVELNPTKIVLPTKWDENCEFPIWTAPLKFGQVPPLPYGSFKNLPGITVAAHTIIEALQPYYDLGEVNNSLRFLKELSNIDKHRHLALTRSRSYISERRTFANGIIGTGIRALDHGAEIDLLQTGSDGYATVEVDFAVSTFVTFNEAVLASGCAISVQQMLELILDAVEGFVVPAFRKLIQNP